MEFITSGPIQSVYATLLLVAILWVAYRAGLMVLNALVINKDLTQLEVIIFAVAIGLPVLTLGVLTLGILAKLNIVWVSGWLVVLVITSFFIPAKPASPQNLSPPSTLNCLWKPITITIAVLMVFLSWVQALMPPIGIDALAYHLEIAKWFVKAQQALYLPTTRESLWPFQTEMLYVLGLMFEGTTLTKLFHWSFYVLSTLAVFAFVRRFYGQRYPTAPWAAMLFYLLTPAAFAQSGYAYVDLSFSFFIFVSFYAFLLKSEVGYSRCAFLSGLMCAAAASTKLLGVIPMAIIFISWAIVSRFRVRVLTLFLIGCMIAAPWYIRSWIVSGNPVYPFYPHLFGGNGYLIDMAEGVGMGHDLKSFFLLGWNMIMYPKNFGGESMGVLFLLFIPPLVFYIKKAKWVSLYLAVAVTLYTFGIYNLSQHARFYLSVTIFLSVGCAVSWELMRREGRYLRWFTGIVTIFLCLLHLSIAGYRTRNAWAVVTGFTSAPEYLSNYERSFKGYLYLKKHMLPGEKVFNASGVRFFYAPDKNIGESYLAIRDWKHAENKLQLEDYLDDVKPTYLWLSEHDSAQSFFDYARTRGYRVVYDYDFSEGDRDFHEMIYRRIERGD